MTDKQEQDRHTFEATVLLKLERIEETLVNYSEKGSAFEQVTRERLDGMKWTAAIIGGLVSFVITALGIVASLFRKS